MVEIADIKDRKSLRAWLETQPQKTSVAIVHRAVMREMPDYWNWVMTPNASQTFTSVVIPVLRCCLISGTAAFYPTQVINKHIKLAAYGSAVYASDHNSKDSHYKSYASSYATYLFAPVAAYTSADDSGYAARVVNAVADISTVNSINTVDAKTIRSALEGDYFGLVNGKSLDREKLWRDEPNPYADEWQKTKEILQDDPIDWSFWIKWYEASLNGEPLNYDMLEKIALIDPKDWELGPEYVNAIIAGIEAEFDTQDDRKTIKDILERNTNVIEAQLDALVLLATEEILHIHGSNNITSAESDQIAVRVSLLNSIIASVEKIRESLTNTQSQTNALVVIDAQLSEIAVVAEKLAEDETMQEISAPIMAMGVTIKYLTDCGTPGHVASGAAVFEYGAKWLKAKRSK